MADDPTKHARDAKFINMGQDYEVEYWTQELGVSKERLGEVIEEVGNKAEDVRGRLGK